MLPKPFRLPGHRTLSLLKSSQFYSSSLLTIKILKKDQSQTQIGFIVSSKTCRLAVDRNRLKRQLRQAVLSFLPRIKPNYEILILAKPQLINQSLIAIQNDLLGLFKSCSLLN